MRKSYNIMFSSISDYLQKFDKLNPPQYFVKQAVIKCVYSCLNIELEADEVSFKEGIVYVKTHPVVKSEIKLNKKNILEQIAKGVGEKKVFDIR